MLLLDVIPDFVENLPLFQLWNVWFQHDGASAHYTSSVKQYLVEWPPCSPDLTPMDVFLWGYLKQQAYATPAQTLQVFQRRITDACANVTLAILHRVHREV
ncbi:hypothetical protein AVEN_61652-1 [Araneus ventricosus]|uniref:Tc1-like transposase DDE domain-containing protein n=1 Tax=Araneus ventricosus TaxID=182803 RepID=A0A4Y2UMV1_ARAVE|nr:hypothetical protein AVEN_61652-1 [Araneus ventricosus]